MIYELRIYTCYPGTDELVLKMWNEEGKAMLEPYFKMIGQWTGMNGIASQIYTLWEFKDLNHWRDSRSALMKHPGFKDYLDRCRKYYIKQESTFLLPTIMSPIK